MDKELQFVWGEPAPTLMKMIRYRWNLLSRLERRLCAYIFRASI